MNFRQVRGIYRLHHVELGSGILLSVQFNGECGRLHPQPLGNSGHSQSCIAQDKNTRNVREQSCMDITVITQLYCQLYITRQLHVSANTVFGHHQVGYNYRRKLHNM